MSMLRMHRSGVLIDPLNPQPESFRVEDIAYGLAGTYRYRGQSRLTVAEHCCRGCDWMVANAMGADLAWEFLMHDAPEYLLGDVPSPLKLSPVMEEYLAAERHVSALMAERYAYPAEKSKAVHKLDVQLRAHEQWLIWGRASQLEDEYEPLVIKWRSPNGFWDPIWAESEWLFRFNTLAPAAATVRMERVVMEAEPA